MFNASRTLTARELILRVVSANFGCLRLVFALLVVFARRPAAYQLHQFARRHAPHLVAAVQQAFGELALLRVQGQDRFLDGVWFVEARARTTKFALGERIIQPHMLVPVAGLGRRYDGEYFVTAVTHTLDNDGHAMDLTLARNALGA